MYHLQHVQGVVRPHDGGTGGRKLANIHHQLLGERLALLGAEDSQREVVAHSGGEDGEEFVVVVPYSLGPEPAADLIVVEAISTAWAVSREG